MRFDELSRGAARDLHAESRRVVRPDISAVDGARRRRSDVLKAAGALVATVAVFGGGLFWLGGGSTEEVVVATTTVPTTTVAPIPEVPDAPLLSQTFDLLDGTSIDVTTPAELILEGYSFFLDRPGLGGEKLVSIARGTASDMAAGESAVIERGLGGSMTLWRAEREGEPIFMAVQMNGFTSWLNVGYRSPPDEEELAAIAFLTAGDATGDGVVLRDSSVALFSTFLTSGEGLKVTVRAGECLRERVPGSEITRYPRVGEVVRLDTYASWCLPGDGLEIAVDGPHEFVDLMVETLSVTRIGPQPSPVTPPSTGAPQAVPQAEPLWEWRGIGIGSSVLTDDELVFAADGFLGDRISSLEAGTGNVVWHRPVGGPLGTSFLLTLDRGIVLASGHFSKLVAITADTGDDLWDLEVPDGYGAVSAVPWGDMFVVGTDAPTEGDTRPPIVYALDQATGVVRWSVELAEGTDLQWGAPGANEGIVVFQSTLSHPGSASGNMAHALEIGDGAIRWIVDMGGAQDFTFWPSIVRAGRVALHGPTGIVSVDSITGEIVGEWAGVLSFSTSGWCTPSQPSSTVANMLR